MDATIAGLGIQNCNYWFNAFSNFTEVRGFENLSGMTSVDQMFSICASLETILDLGATFERASWARSASTRVPRRSWAVTAPYGQAYMQGYVGSPYTEAIYEEQTVQTGSHKEDHGHYVTETYVDYVYCSSCGARK